MKKRKTHSHKPTSLDLQEREGLTSFNHPVKLPRNNKIKFKVSRCSVCQMLCVCVVFSFRGEVQVHSCLVDMNECNRRGTVLLPLINILAEFVVWPTTNLI